MFTSALGFTLERELADDTVRTFVRGDECLGDGGGCRGGGTELTASGTRQTDSSTATGGETYGGTVNLEELSASGDQVEVRDRYPPEWTLLEDSSDGQAVDEGNGVVSFGEIPSEDFDGDSFTYFLEAPEGIGNSDHYTVGPAEVVHDGETAEFAGTQDVLLVGVSV